MNVPGEPLLSPLLLAASLLPPWRDARRVLPHASVRLYRLGRDALADAVATLPPGPVLVPAFICREAVGALRAAGRAVRFYALRTNLEPDWARLDLDKEGAQGAAALVLVHYFGVPASVAEARRWCDERRIALIEDCAHSFMSRSEGAQVGSTGDFALYSFRKQLPVASGAALVWNRPHSGLQLRPPEGRSTPGILPALREAASWTVFASGSRRLREWLAPALSDERGLHAAPPGRAPAMDVVTRMVVGRLSARLDEIAVRRRANYRTVESMLGGLPEFTPFFSALPPGAVPWGFPLRVGASAQDRDGALSVLLREGIGAWAWPELPDEVTEARFPDEYRWAREALVLPVHQGLRGQQAQQVADTLAGWAVGHSGEA